MITKVMAVAAAAALVLTAAPAQAGGGAPAPPWPVATGLDNPRGLAFGPAGELYVAEAGRGGPGPCRPGPEGGTVCFGRSGAITRIQYGHQRRVVKKLPSNAAPDGTQAIGPSDVAVDRRGRVYFTVGLGGSPDLRTQIKELTGTAKLYRDGRPVADLGAYEKRVNPDGVVPADTNPNSVLAVRDGELVADAGGNSLVRVDPRGRLTTVATFPAQQVPVAGALVPMQAVPTSVVIGPDGAFYVGELTGFPFAPGKARIWRVRPGHAPTVYATGFTNIIDLAWGPGGKLYVLEIARNGLLSGDQTGALLRVDRNGAPATVVSTGLTAPGGLAVRGHDAYVSNCSVCKGTGSVLKFSLK
jgi:sugar lactone lactonase YvrE